MSAPSDDPFAPPSVDPRPALSAASEARDVRVFALDDQGLAALGRRFRNGTLVSLGVLSISATALVLMGHGFSPLVAATALLMLGVMGVFGYRLQLERFETYRIEVAGDRVTRRLRGFADATIARAELSSLVERRDGLELRGAAGVVVFVRVELPGYAEIRAQLAEWMPVRASRPLRASLGIVAVVLVSGVSGPLAMSSSSRPVAVGACAVVVATTGYFIWDAWRSKRMHVRAWFVIVPLVALSMFGLVARVVKLLLSPD